MSMNFWEKDDSGNKLGVGVCSESFIYWLNEFVLKDSKEKAYIVRKSISNKDTLFLQKDPFKN